jgi:polysaccharide pyruvyl transferase WcaK-like protein
MWLYHAATLSMASQLGHSILLAPCSVGPFPGIHDSVARRLFRTFSRILVREHLSIPYLEGLGVQKDRIELAPDLAFCLRRPASDPFLLPLGAPWVAVSVRPHHFDGWPDSTQALSTYLDAVATAVKTVIDDFGVRVVVVRQVLDDHSVSLKLLERIGRPTELLYLDDDLRVENLIAVYSQCELMIGTRMHANILALLAGVPVVAIAYEHKTTGIMRMLELDEYVVPIDFAADELVPTVRRAWAARVELRSLIRPRMAILDSWARKSVLSSMRTTFTIDQESLNPEGEESDSALRSSDSQYGRSIVGASRQARRVTGRVLRTGVIEQLVFRTSRPFRRHNGTDRFNLSEQNAASWDDRARAAVLLCSPAAALLARPAGALTVADLGCGNRRLGGLLSAGLGTPHRYTGFDLLPQSADTRRLDLNQEVPSEKFDIVFGLGVMEYLNDVPAFLGRLRGLGEFMVVSYVVSDSQVRAFSEPSARKARGWISHYTKQQLMSLVSEAGLRVRDSVSIDGGSTLIVLLQGDRD